MSMEPLSFIQLFQCKYRAQDNRQEVVRVSFPNNALKRAAISLGRDALKGPTNRLLILEPEAGVEDWSAACWRRRSAGIEQH